jgi:uncharacterized protein
MKRLIKILLLAIGSLSIVLGILGMFLPLLPTTPFLLLAAICYGRSSDRAYNWLITNRWFGEYIKNYREGRGIPLRSKILTILLLWLSIGYGVIAGPPVWWLRTILIGIAVGVTIHLFRVNTYRPEAKEDSASSAKHAVFAEGRQID